MYALRKVLFKYETLRNTNRLEVLDADVGKLLETTKRFLLIDYDHTGQVQHKLPQPDESRGRLCECTNRTMPIQPYIGTFVLVFVANGSTTALGVMNEAKNASVIRYHFFRQRAMHVARGQAETTNGSRTFPECV